MYVYVYVLHVQNQLCSSNISLTDAQQEIDKLRAQLKKQHELAEASSVQLNKQHSAVVKGLQNKVAMYSTVILCQAVCLTD